MTRLGVTFRFQARLNPSKTRLNPSKPRLNPPKPPLMIVQGDNVRYDHLCFPVSIFVLINHMAPRACHVVSTRESLRS